MKNQIQNLPEKDLHVLMIAHSYDDLYEPMSGIFFSDLAEAMVSEKMHTGVVSVNLISLKSIFHQKKLKIGLRKVPGVGIDGFIIDVPSLPYLKGWNRWLRNQLLIMLIKKYLKTYGKPNIAHVHVFYSGQSGLWLKKKHNIPVVITEHFSVFARGLTTRAELSFAKEIFQKSDARTAVSSEFCSLLEKMFHVPFEFVPNVVHTDFFTPPNHKAPSEVKHIIAVGSLDENKNHQLLIDALCQINDISFDLTIVGDGPLKEHLKNYVIHKQLNDKIRFFGVATKEQLKELYQQSDLMVLASKYETFGVVLIEAMSCGLPVVATKCGGPESIIQNEQVGFLCEINTEDMAKHIRLALNKSWNSEYIRNYAVENYSAKAVVEKLNDIFLKVINKSH